MNHKSNKDAKSEPQNQAACSVWLCVGKAGDHLGMEETS